MGRQVGHPKMRFTPSCGAILIRPTALTASYDLLLERFGYNPPIVIYPS